MRSLLFALAFFFALSFAADSDVVVLTTDSFSQTSTGIWLVEFYAPWCGHCKRLVPTWEELATTVKGKFNVAKVDCTVEKDVATNNGIRGFPTIKLFNNGQVTEFNGARTVDAFVEFVESSTGSKFGIEKKAAAAPPKPAEAEAGSASKDLVILTDATFSQKTATGTWLVKFYAPWCGHCKRLAPTWDELATQVKGRFNVAKVDCTVETGSCSDIRGYPTIKLFHEGVVTPYNGPRTIDAFTEFVREKTGGAETLGEQAKAVEEVPQKKDAGVVEQEGDLVVLTNENFDALTSDGVWFVKFYAPWCGHCKKLAPTWSQYATTVKDRSLGYKVGKVDCTIQKDVCQKFAIRGYPTLKLLKGGDAYDYNGGREESAFLKFVDDYFTAWGVDKQEL